MTTAMSAVARPRLERLEVDTDRVLQAVATVGFADIRRLFEAGRLLQNWHPEGKQ